MHFTKSSYQKIKKKYLQSNLQFEEIRLPNDFNLKNIFPEINDEILIDLEKNISKLPIPIQFELNVKFIKDKWDMNEAFLNREALKKPLSLRKFKKTPRDFLNFPNIFLNFL